MEGGWWKMVEGFFGLVEGWWKGWWKVPIVPLEPEAVEPSLVAPYR